jgi:hypothetical protein
MRIQSNDPKENKEDRKRVRATSLEAEGKKHEKAGKNPRIKNLPANCKELNEVLKIYSKMVNTPIKTLI